MFKIYDHKILGDSLNHNNQANVIEAFNSTTRHLDDLLNIDSPYFEGMISHILRGKCLSPILLISRKTRKT